MNLGISTHYTILPEVARALRMEMPIVALESAVVTHGLPYPQNLHLAQDMETEIRTLNAVPATIGVLDGLVQIGLTAEQLQRLASEKNLLKVSRRDYAIAVAQKKSGGTTVAGTLIAAHAAGILVFATGGIGGVHRQAPDISPDLPELSRTPVVVVCAGAKSILDLPATLEYLETMSVPVIGYQTNDFPAFYAVKSGLKTQGRAESPEEIAAIARAHWMLGLHSAILVVQPPPAESALTEEAMEIAITLALKEAQNQQITGQAVTPFLLSRMSQLTGGASMTANLALLRNNARLAASIAIALRPPSSKMGYV
jgi:pseudouridine-5'-phosphate glycosidase